MPAISRWFVITGRSVSRAVDALRNSGHCGLVISRPTCATGSVVGKQGKRPVWFATTGKETLERLVMANPSGPILRGTRGQPWLKTALEECHRRISRKIGVVVTPKQTRKRFATKCIAAGISPAIVAKLLGHKSYDMTMRHYVGFEQQTLINALDRLV